MAAADFLIRCDDGPFPLVPCPECHGRGIEPEPDDDRDDGYRFFSRRNDYWPGPPQCGFCVGAGWVDEEPRSANDLDTEEEEGWTPMTDELPQRATQLFGTSRVFVRDDKYFQVSFETAGGLTLETVMRVDQAEELIGQLSDAIRQVAAPSGERPLAQMAARVQARGPTVEPNEAPDRLPPDDGFVPAWPLPPPRRPSELEMAHRDLVDLRQRISLLESGRAR